MTASSVFGDPERIVVDVLTAAFNGRDDEPAAVAMAFPSAALADNATRIQVDMESDSADDYPVTARAQVRVTVHAHRSDRTLVKATTDAARALLAGAVHEAAAGFVPSGRSAVSQDPDTGNLMCWFRVRVDLLAIPLAS